MDHAQKAFGPSAIATPANALTLARLCAGPVYGVLVYESGPATWWLLGLWMVLAGSDGLDGYLARWHGTTRSGAFLDPLADKFLVLGALCALCALGVVSWVPIALIAARELLMSLYRIRVAAEGVSVPARPLAKLKTVVQLSVVTVAVVPPIEPHHAGVVRIILWVAVALTIVTGIEYFFDAKRMIRARPMDQRISSGIA